MAMPLQYRTTILSSRDIIVNFLMGMGQIRFYSLNDTLYATSLPLIAPRRGVALGIELGGYGP
jgi:hypothetical protein